MRSVAAQARFVCAHLVFANRAHIALSLYKGYAMSTKLQDIDNELLRFTSLLLILTTLHYVRLLQVFGKLLSPGAAEEKLDKAEGSFEDVDLREHMVGILFSRSKLTHLQKQVSRTVCPAVKWNLCRWLVNINLV